jgi:spermidine/putrescine transport system permease protein
MAKWLNTIRKEFPFIVGVPALVWQVLFFVVPLFCIIGLAFMGKPFEYFLPFIDPVYGAVIMRSLGMALSNSVICLCIAYPLTYFLAFKAGRLRIPGLFLLIVPFWTNFLLHIYAWFFVLEKNGFLNTVLLKIGLIGQPLDLLNSWFAVMIMMVYYYMPFMILPLYTQFEKFDNRLFEASLDLGASWLQTIWYVLIPATMPGIISGFFLVFVPSFGEFAIPELMGGDKFLCVGSLVSYCVLGAETASYGAAFTFMSSCVLIGVSVIMYIILSRTIRVRV